MGQVLPTEKKLCEGKRKKKKKILTFCGDTLEKK